MAAGEMALKRTRFSVNQNIYIKESKLKIAHRRKTNRTGTGSFIDSGAGKQNSENKQRKQKHENLPRSPENLPEDRERRRIKKNAAILKIEYRRA